MPLYFHAPLDRMIFINLVFARTAVKASPAACKTRAVRVKTLRNNTPLRQHGAEWLNPKYVAVFLRSGGFGF